jgi:serine phosphatase RsbU (regulator of sigma subunit)
LFLSVSFIVVSLTCVILLVAFSFLRVMHYKDDVNFALSTYAKWSVLNNNTKVLLMADKNVNDAFENWRASLRDFTEQHELLVESSRIRAMGYEMDGILQQSKGLWGFYRTIVDQVIDILDTDEGKAIFKALESNQVSILTAMEREKNISIDPKVMQNIRKIREYLKFSRNTSEIATEPTQTSAENDFNWLWNNSFIPLLEKEIATQMHRIAVSAIILSLIIILVSILITIVIVRSITRPLNQFLNIVIEGAKGNLSVRFPVAQKTRDAAARALQRIGVSYNSPDTPCFVEIGSFAPLFDKKVSCTFLLSGKTKECPECAVYRTICKEDMSVVGTWFNVLMTNLERSVKFIRDAQLIWRKSMSMSPQIQRSVYPQKSTSAEPWDVVSFFKSATEVSGNFYDYYFVDNHLRGVGLFNVSGHGISVALMTVISKSLIFRLFGRMQDAPLGKVIKNANDALTQEIGEAEHYLTGILLRIREDGIEYVNTGLPNLLLRNSLGHSVSEIKIKEVKISGSVSSPEKTKKEFQDVTITVNPNDFIFLCNDGLTQVKNQQGQIYGTDRLNESLLSAPGDGTAQQIMEFILQGVYTFTGRKDLSNDIATIVLKKK